MATSFAFRLKPPAEGSVFHDTFGGIRDVLDEMNQKLTQLTDETDFSDLDKDVLIFLIGSVVADEEKKDFPFKGSHPWVRMLTGAGFDSLAELAALDGSAADAAAEIEVALRVPPEPSGQLPEGAPTVDELEQLVEIARILTEPDEEITRATARTQRRVKMASAKAPSRPAGGRRGARKRKGKRG